ncbi:MAG: hypothetical protein FWH41_03875 [Treponema sp.]|nr:hypothetical protein [Treponema sp.]
MDDRKKQINELEQRKLEQKTLLDAQLTRFGETLFNRISDSTEDSAFEELVSSRMLKEDLAQSEQKIATAEENIFRFKELEEKIALGEREENIYLKEMSSLYLGLGKLLLEASYTAEKTGEEKNYANFCAQFRTQSDALISKILSLEDRLAGLEQKDGGNVFSWIGKNAQGLVLRSFLSKAQNSMDILYRTIGEKFSRRDTVNIHNGKNSGAHDFSPEDEEISNLCAEIELKREISRQLAQEITGFRDEKRKISTAYSAEGSPQKFIQSIKNHAARAENELKEIYRRIGTEASEISGPAECRAAIESLKISTDQIEIDNILKIDQFIKDDEKSIQGLRASLAVDEEKARIEKFRRLILEKKEKIAQIKKSIGEYEKGIIDAEEHIEKLQEHL